MWIVFVWWLGTYIYYVVRTTFYRQKFVVLSISVVWFCGLAGIHCYWNQFTIVCYCTEKFGFFSSILVGGLNSVRFLFFYFFLLGLYSHAECTNNITVCFAQQKYVLAFYNVYKIHIHDIYNRENILHIILKGENIFILYHIIPFSSSFRIYINRIGRNSAPQLKVYLCILSYIASEPKISLDRPSHSFGCCDRNP